MATVRLFLLGRPRAERDGRALTLGPAKGVALLAYLALTGMPQPRERVLALLWPESAPEAARKNLRNTLWTLRRALGEEALAGDEERLALSPGVWVDAVALASGPSASGPSASDPPLAGAPLAGAPLSDAPLSDAPQAELLAGFNLPGAGEFQLWLDGERERLRQLQLRMLGERAMAARAIGDWDAVVAAARQGLALDDLHEPLYRLIIEAHARRGERGEALRQYDALRARLAAELGVEPLPETQALRAAVLAEPSPPPAAPPATPSPARPPARRAAPAGPPPAPFVGRQKELATLEAERAAAAGGQARAVLVTGELGLGKSRLISEWAARVAAGASGATVLVARCLASTQALPFAPLVELLTRQACFERLFRPASPVAPLWLAEIARLVPELRAARPDLPVPPRLPPEEERGRVLEALTRLFQALDARPLVLVVDDLQWADRATLDWLDYLLDRLQAGPLLLVAAYRVDEAPAPLVNLAAGWLRAGLARRLPLERLTPGEAGALAAALGAAPPRAERVLAHSGGNPYFLIELLRAGPEADVPPDLAELVRARLADLPPAARQLAQAAAVLEPDFDFVALAHAAGLGEDADAALDALDALLAAAVLVERDSRYAFAHPFVAAVVRDGLSGARRTTLHRRAAEALEAGDAARRPALAGRLANHYAQAGEPERAADYFEEAARHALAVAATDEAAGFYRQALALAPTPARHEGLAGALISLGEIGEARAAYTAALEAAQAARDQSSAARAMLGLAGSYLLSSDGDEIIPYAEQVLAGCDAGQDPAAVAEAHFLAGAARLMEEREPEAAERHLIQAAELAAANDLPGVAARARFELGNLHARSGDLAAALAAFRESIALAQAAGDELQAVLGHNNAAYHALLAGDLAAAREHVNAGLALAETRALRLPLQYLYSTRGELALAESDWDAAAEYFARGLPEAERMGDRRQIANYRANQALAARGRGDLDGALALLGEARALAAPLGARHLQAQIELWLVEVHRARGERAAAGEALARAAARLAGSGYQRLEQWLERLRAEQLRL